MDNALRDALERFAARLDNEGQTAYADHLLHLLNEYAD